MNFGANVFELWLPLRLEVDLCRLIGTGARLEPLLGEKEWLRLCAGESGGRGDGLTTADIGLSFGFVGPGEGDAESLLKGLLRHRGPLPATEDIALR